MDLFKHKREFLNGVVIQTIITPEEKKWNRKLLSPKHAQWHKGCKQCGLVLQTISWKLMPFSKTTVWIRQELGKFYLIPQLQAHLTKNENTGKVDIDA